MGGFASNDNKSKEISKRCYMTCFIIWRVSVKATIFAPLSWKQSFYLKKKLIPIENWKMELCEKPHFFCFILKVTKPCYSVFERGILLHIYCFFALKEPIWRTSLRTIIVIADKSLSYNFSLSVCAYFRFLRHCVLCYLFY